MFARLALIGLILVVTACTDIFGPKKRDGDLSCASGTLTVTGSNAGYANFQRTQNDWHPSDTLGDYRYFNNRKGGSGNTLEYLGCSGANFVWLDWEFNAFHAVAVRAPWSGQTDKGLHIGDDSIRFHLLYPTAHPIASDFSWPKDFDVWDQGPLRVVLKEGRVYIIQVEWAFADVAPNQDQKDWVESHRTNIGPRPCVGCPGR